MALVFWLTFNVIGAWLQVLLEQFIGWLTELADAGMTAWNVNDALHSLIINGIFNGVGSVLSFLPIIVTLFFFLSLLEDTGYMARVAFVMDKLLRKIGLSGRSIVPMLVGFGCSVPGVMASRTLPSERDRKMTIMLIPFMSCTAKLPIYGFFTAAFFPEYSGLIMVALYFGGIAVGILVAMIAKNSIFKGDAVPFVMELPNYRMPGAKNVLQLLWDKAKDFLQRAFTVIFLATIIVWFLTTFSLHLNMVTESKDSILAGIDHRFYCQRERCFHIIYFVWDNNCTDVADIDKSSGSIACILFALYAVYSCHCIHTKGAGTEMGHWCGYSAVRHCMGMRICHVSFADVFVTDDIFYFTGCFSESSRKAAFYVADSDAYFVEFLSFSD